MDLTKIAEQLLKLGTAIAVFGYIAFRAHINYLGFSSLGQLQPDRYLMEFYGFLGSFVFAFAGIGCLATIPYFFYLIIDGLCHRRPSYVHFRSQFEQKVLSLFGSSVLTHIVLAAYIGLSFFAVWKIFAWTEVSDVLVGQLLPEKLEYHDRGSGFKILCAAIGIGMLFHRAKIRGRKLPPGSNEKISLQILLGLLVGLSSLLPVIYGLRVRPPSYPSAVVGLKSEKPSSLAGFLIMEDSSTVRLWTLDATGKKGTVVSLEKTEITSLTLGKVQNLLQVASDSLNGKPVLP